MIIKQVVRRKIDQQFIENIGIMNVAPKVARNFHKPSNPLQALKNSKDWASKVGPRQSIDSE